MTQIQVEAAERRLAQLVLYAVLVAPVIAILSRDFGFQPVGPWISYAIIAAPSLCF